MRIPATGSAQPAVLDLGAPYLSGLATNLKQTGWLWLAQGASQSEQLCFAASLGAPCQPIPIPSLTPAALKSAKPQLIHWSSGSLTIEGLLYLPDLPSGGKLPLVVDVHGGPFSAFEDRLDPFGDFLVGHGWALLRPNPRGSSNYGQKFAAANKNDLGGGDYQDIMAGVDYALAHFPLDPARMALIDSQGETLTLASQPVTGLPELMTKQLDEVCMAMHESRSRLFGTAEGELASAEANHKNRAEYVHAWQMMRLVPALTRITQLQFESRNGPKPKPGVKWQIVPNPIDPPNLEKELEQRERQAKVDEMYITQRVLEPSEVRTSRFGGARYSHETNLDPALTGMIEANDKAALDASTEQDKQEETPPPAQA